VLVASLIATLNDVRSRRMTAARALVIGWGLLWAVKQVATPFNNVLGRTVSVAVGNWLLTNGHESARWWWFKTQANFLPSTLVWWTLLGLVGWLVVKVDTEKRPLGALLLATSVAAVNLPLALFPLTRELFTGTPNTRPSEVVLALLTTYLVGFASIVLGGLLANQRSTAGKSHILSGQC
jgi:hypothetical protein